MIRYHIRVNTGDDDHASMYYFVHENYQNISEDESNKCFDDAIKELDRIYKTYGRFATSTGVIRLFESFGFIYTSCD